MNRIANAVVKRLSTHAKDRAQEMLLGLRDFERLKTPHESALTIICDDGELKDLDIVEVLSSVGVKGVFAVSPDLVGRPGFLTYGQLRSVREAGHEIAFHGATHDPFTGFRDKSRLLDVTRDGMARLHAEGLGAPASLIYPFGRNDRSVREAIAPLFDCAFTTWFGINKGATNRFAIRRIPFGAYTGKLPATEAWYRDIIQRCANGGCWPTLMLHPGAMAHTKAHSALLSRLVSYARERHLPVRTVAAHLAAAAVPTAGGHAERLIRDR
jgi:peptidoglycan/xylan/chitin deacetylase (PgdA/CDA1 family)